jgi:hypothetical protein
LIAAEKIKFNPKGAEKQGTQLPISVCPEIPIFIVIPVVFKSESTSGQQWIPAKSVRG